ncbi:MAG: GNAT family N-acetyltransferase [Blastocatellia bacterium]
MMIVGLPLPKLENEAVLLQPLEERDYPALYDLGRDPKIWEQHPQSDRWQEEVFRRFFDEGIRSRGAYRIIEKSSGSLAGTTRIYDADVTKGTIKVGYTFLATRFWGTGLNRKVKELLLNELFSNFQSVFFEIGSRNLRSRIAIERLGARLVEEEKREGAASGEPARLLYRIPREEWMSRGGSARD